MAQDLFVNHKSPRSKSKFRRLSPNTISQYCDPLVHVISLLVWLKFQCHSRKQIVDGVDLGITLEANHALSQLYTFLIALSGRQGLEIDRGDLAKHVHRLLTLLLMGQGSSYRKVDGPFDYALLLAMYVGNGNFQDPEIISRYCAKVQYCMRVIVVHIMRLEGVHIDYLPLLQVDPNLEDQDAEEEEDNPLLPPPALPLPDRYKLITTSLDNMSIDPEHMTIENLLTLDLDERDTNCSATTNSWKSIPTSTSSRFVNLMAPPGKMPEQVSNNVNNFNQDDLLELVFLFHGIQSILTWVRGYAPGCWLVTTSGFLLNPVLERGSNLQHTNE